MYRIAVFNFQVLFFIEQESSTIPSTIKICVFLMY